MYIYHIYTLHWGFFLTIFQISKYKSNFYLVLKVILPLLNFIILGETTWSELVKGQNDSIPVITYHNKSEIKSIFTGLPLAFLELCPLKMLRIPKYFIFRWYLLELNYFNNSHGWTVIDYSSFCNTDICGSDISFALHIDSERVSMLASSVVNHEFDPQSGQTMTIKFVFFLLLS